MVPIQYFEQGKKTAVDEGHNGEVSELHQKIGQLTVEVDWLKKKTESLSLNGKRRTDRSTCHPSAFDQSAMRAPSTQPFHLLLWTSNERQKQTCDFDALDR